MSNYQISNEIDINLAAYLLLRIKNRCEHCNTKKTPQWRKGYYSEILGHSVTLCNACGLKYYKKQFCKHCKIIYNEKYLNLDEWIKCFKCELNIHLNCEGIIQINPYFNQYICIDCNEKNKQIYFSM